MADRRIYTWYYRRYDGKVIYVVAIAKDADTDEDVIIWTLNVYSDKRTYYTMSKRSFFDRIFIDGVRQPKFKRQTRMRVLDSVAESFEAESFFRSPRSKEESSRISRNMGNNSLYRIYSPSFSTKVSSSSIDFTCR